MGRNARRRAEAREEHRGHGVVGDEPDAAPDRPTKCPRCGSTDLVIGPYMAGITTGVDIVCGHCNWHGMIEPGIWYPLMCPGWWVRLPSIAEKFAACAAR